MKPVATQGISMVGAGKILIGNQYLVWAEGKPICVNGAKGTGHLPWPESPSPLPPHSPGFWSTIPTTALFYIGGKPVVRAGDPATCGHSVQLGSFLVFSA